MKKRLEEGDKQYGDASFRGGPEISLRALEEETLDIVGWGYILWTKLRVLQELMEKKRRAINDLDGSL
jgi:hypothetical protein